MPLDTLPATLESVHPLTPRVKQFLVRVEGHVFDFAPGQHVSMAFEDADGNRRYRPYSPVNQPGTDSLALAVKHYPKGAGSTWMHDRTVGDTVPVTSQSGNLRLREPNRDAIFLATGTGLTPRLSMVRHYLDVGDGNAIVLFGERTQDDLMYRETLDLLSANHASLTVEYVLSDEDWPGRSGYVQNHLRPIVDDAAEAQFYVCGVPEMVVETKEVLFDLGISEEWVFTEGWEEGAVEE